MSDTDNFIDEVNEEVRRDRLYALLRRYGWIPVLAVVLIVGGAAWSEYNKSLTRANAEALGDGMLAALADNDSTTRAAALAALEPSNAPSGAVLGLMTAAQQVEAGETNAARATLNGVSTNGDVPLLYRQIAQFKAMTLADDTTPEEEKLQAFESMAQPGNPLRLLAQEQLALYEISQGKPDSAIELYQAILADAEVSADLQQRALQVIVALGGEPNLDDVSVSSLGDTGLN